MNIYVDKFPESCECCPCNDDYYRCGLSGDLFDLHCIYKRRMKNCKLKQLADVRENVRGEWIKPISRGDVLSYGKAYYECDQCHKVAFFGNKMNFCPNCGADMRGES